MNEEQKTDFLTVRKVFILPIDVIDKSVGQKPIILKLSKTGISFHIKKTENIYKDTINKIIAYSIKNSAIKTAAENK